MHEFVAESSDEAVDDEPGGGVDGQDEVVEVDQTLGRIDAGARDAGSHQLVGHHDFVDVFQNPRQMANEKDDDDGGQCGGIIGLTPVEQQEKKQCFLKTAAA